MLNNKRIILTVTNDLTHDRRMFRICSSLSEAGAEVILIGRRWKDSKSFSPPGFKGVRLKCIFNKGPLFYIEYNKRLFFHLVTHKYDVVCACDLDTALSVRWASFFNAGKTVYDAHEFFTEVPELTGRPAIKRIWEWIGRATIPHFNLRYTVGDELASLMRKKYSVDFQVIRNIAPHQGKQVENIPIENRKKILLYQGALNVGRGLEDCIKSISMLPEWEFWLAGEGDITDQLKDLTEKLNLKQQIKFLGWVHPDNLPGLMNQAKLGINMRETGSLNDFYSLPNKFFDCIHAGLPSINMNYPEYKTVNDKYPCSILIDEVSPESIVNTIQHIDQHPEELIRMSKACIDAAKEFTWEKESAKLVKLYENLLD
ncbi:MAG: glycosyltransferase [Saprospiraceae bacterium]